MKVKICGLAHVTNANEIAQLNPDFIGCIFSSASKRFITLEQAKQINHPQKIGVFVNQSIAEIVNIATNCSLYGAQLHGSESVAFCLALKQQIPLLKIIKAFSIAQLADFDAIEDYENAVDYFLFDTKGKDFGGNGIVFNWEMLNQITCNKPYFLAGGIDVAALSQINNLQNKPFVIDANSKLEDAIGIKNNNKTKQLITYVQSI
ncbi:phosphoribosylanthranilate isomerase [Flavobacterium agricola]|uniref:N-(5'-phosphoribosyl)anthranilate isomerase n=1 Tax=Flavobacterium agricola TaxID=2870839 RepID=A0ABY6LZ85_9FLAO|nr:phosphoribosylanthranilate isomerase [Flavobacterium agricola]UYW01601.1 phosphoribosylanthranilate isomerase [Flavobacterium agricola]